MATRRFELEMPASSAAVFEAFHNHRVRLNWDTLLREAYVEGGGSHPFVGAITVNKGRGWKRFFSMRTRFVTYQPPTIAAAHLVSPTGVFAKWAATMQHRDIGPDRSVMTYSFNLALRPAVLGLLFDRFTTALFEHEARRRFAAMAKYLTRQARGSVR